MSNKNKIQKAGCAVGPGFDSWLGSLEFACPLFA